MIRLAIPSRNLAPKSPRTILLSLLLLVLVTSACNNSSSNPGSGTSSSAPAATSSSSGSSGGGEAFEGLITSKMTASNQQMEIKYAVKGSRTRIETQLAAGGTQMGVVLMDFAAGSQTMLIPQMKTYTTINWNDQGGIKSMAENMTGDASFKATPTGKTETIAGHSCTHWILGEKQDTDACLAKGLGYFGGGGDSGSVFEKLRNFALGDKAKAALQSNPEFLQFIEGGVFPLKLSIIENGQSRTLMEVTRVERKPLDDSIFAIPPDFKKMEIPGMPTGKK
ncbi:MAG: DUF4412 domain-containing protein [Acidobacteria bacterium]|nr:DUF4412 domain-containing protein [Acidobacteriota bacterium]